MEESQFRLRRPWRDLGQDGLAEGADRLIRQRIEPATALNHSTAARAWIHFTNRELISIIPSAQAVQHFITQLALSEYAPGTIDNYLSGLRAWMADAGLEQLWDECILNPRTVRLRQGVRKRDGRLRGEHAPRRKPPVGAPELRTIGGALGREYDCHSP